MSTPETPPPQEPKKNIGTILLRWFSLAVMLAIVKTCASH